MSSVAANHLSNHSAQKLYYCLESSESERGYPPPREILNEEKEELRVQVDLQDKEREKRGGYKETYGNACGEIPVYILQQAHIHFVCTRVHQ